MRAKAIIHVDMDAFYAAIEQRDNPDLKGKPVIIGADPKNGRGVVSTASYEARRYGVRSAMPISQAYRLCPHGFFLPVNGEKYKKVSQEIKDIFYRYTPLVEPIALDEAFLDLGGNVDVIHIAKEIQNKIYSETGLSASIGVSYNKFLAKLASDWKKPRGFFVIREEDVKKKVWPLPVDKIWGVGPKTKQLLLNWGITTIGCLAKCSPDLLKSKLGQHGEELRLLALGIDERPVKADSSVKSIGKETTFLHDTNDREYLKTVLLTLSENVGYRLRKNGYLCNTIMLKLRNSDFKTITRNQSLNEPTNIDQVIYETAKTLLIKNWSGEPLRLLGISASNLLPESMRQLTFFNDDRNINLVKAIDSIRSKHGFGSIKRARVLQVKPSKGDESVNG